MSNRGMDRRQQFHHSSFIIHHSGFTLIELLVVIGIIGVLIALLFPAVAAARAAADRSKAIAEVHALATALKAYENEYSKFPKLGGSPTEGAALSTTSQLVNLLRGQTVNNENTRRIPFLELSDLSISGGSFVDPWGHAYQYMCDFNYDNTVKANVSGVSTNLQGQSVAVWSTGPDTANRKDDLLSWQ